MLANKARTFGGRTRYTSVYIMRKNHLVLVFNREGAACGRIRARTCGRCPCIILHPSPHRKIISPIDIVRYGEE